MPGDPLRAKFIAENFLDNPRLVTDVRGMLGFTGSYKGQPLSVMGHGVGIPSCSLYCTELINEFGVKRLIRGRQLRQRKQIGETAGYRYRHGRLYRFKGESHSFQES